MDELGTFSEVILTSGVALRVGLMIAISMILGYLIYEDMDAFNKGSLIRIIIVLASFLLLEAWVRSSIFEEMSHPIGNVVPTIVSVGTGAIFLVSLSIGMYMALRVARFKRGQNKKTEAIIEDIKVNGTKANLDVRTEPLPKEEN